MFWLLVVGILYVTFITFYREAKPLIHVGVILLLLFISPVFSGFAGLPDLGPEGIGRFLAKVIDYYMEVLRSFATASRGM